MRRYKLPIVITSSVALLATATAGLLFLSPTAHAANALDFKANNIIDSGIFFNNSSMTPSQIQAFLNSKVPSCDTNGSKMYNGSMTRAQYGASQGAAAPYTCLRDFSENTPAKAGETGLCNPYPGGPRSAAQIIYDVGMICGINPQVLIVLLQKEQSLITDDWPWPIQYRSATGYGCPDTAPCDSEYYGFFNQVYNAGRIYRKYAKDAHLFNYRAERNNLIQYNPNGACGGSTLFLQGQATAGLYNYTPYQPNGAALANLYGTGDSCSAYGNRNFWRMFYDWFGSTTGTSLIQASGSTVYLTAAGTRYSVPTAEMLGNYAFMSTVITPTSDAYVNGLTDGGMLSTLFTVSGDPTVYVADNGVKYGIPSGAMCTAWGFDCANNVKQISYNDANRLANGGTLQPLLQFGMTIYKMVNGKRLPYMSQAAMTGDGYNGSNVTRMYSGYNIGSGVGTSIVENNAPIRFGANPTVYFYTGGNYYAFPNGETLRSWFPSGGSYFDNISTYASTPPPSAGTLNVMVRTGSDKTYLLSGGKRIDVTSRSANWPAPVSFSTTDSFVNSLPLAGTDTASTTYRSPLGAIAAMSGGTRMIFPSMNDFNSIGYSLGDTVNLTQDAFNLMPEGLFAVGEGSVFKVSGSTAIYLKGPGNSVYYLLNESQLGQFRLTREDPALPSNQLSLYATPKPLSSFVSLNGDPSANALVDATSKIWNFGSTQASQWGISNPGLTGMTNPGMTVNALKPTYATVPQFALYNGTVYYGNGGKKHPIATYQSYLQLGGNSSNTFNATKDFIDAAPTGPIL